MGRGKRTKSRVPETTRSHKTSLFAEDYDPEIEELIERHAEHVWNSLDHPGDCSEASLAWGALIDRETDRDVQYVFGDYLGYLDEETQRAIYQGSSAPGLAEHVWLEIDGAIFDPTAGQYSPVHGVWLREDYREEGRVPIKKAQKL